MSLKNENTVVSLFKNIKVYEVDASDSHIKKFDLISNNGSMEIYIIDHLNQVNLKLVSNGLNSLMDTIHLDTKLNDFNLKANSSNRIELKRKDFTNSKKYYAVEFFDNDDNERFKNYLDYLKEIYQINNNENDIEMVSPDSVVSKKDLKSNQKNEDLIELCLKLKESILIGDICLASMYAIKIAELKPELIIEPVIQEKSEVNNNEPQDTKINENLDSSVLKKIEINFKYDNNFNELNEYNQKLETHLDTLTTKVSDLKNIISSHFKIPIDQQLIIINECSTNDNDIINDYAKSLFTKPNTASNLCSESDQFIVHVLTISSIDEICVEIEDEWICDECKYDNIGERCTNCFAMKPSKEHLKKRLTDDEILLFKKQVGL